MQCIADIAQIGMGDGFFLNGAVFLRLRDGFGSKGRGGQRHNGHEVLLVQCHNVAGCHPGKECQRNGKAENKHEIHEPAEATGALFPPSQLGGGGVRNFALFPFAFDRHRVATFPGALYLLLQRRKGFECPAGCCGISFFPFVGHKNLRQITLRIRL